MGRVTTVALGMLFLLVSTTLGADEKGTKKQLAGTWTRTVGDNTITFTFKGDSLHAVLKAGSNTTQVDANYGVSEDGVLFGRISKVKKEDSNGPSEGELFSFQFKIDNKTLTVSDLKTLTDSAEARELVEGDYHKQKKAK